jgi:hypothetical protein
MKFPPFSAQIAKKKMKLSCCDRCNRAEWIEAVATASFCRCGLRRRPATKAELEEYRVLLAESQAAAAKTPDKLTDGNP